mmetsp:Transcript_1228/g.4564  ORF Transcript_1228/g.4564 Transcript_1228/m.4564 type:complete len:134 (+) Transcript_1228:2-403(+)
MHSMRRKPSLSSVSRLAQRQVSSRAPSRALAVSQPAHSRAATGAFSPRRRRDERQKSALAPVSSKEGEGERELVCPVCRGTSFKACGQCEGSGVNLEPRFNGEGPFAKGAPCWLCEGTGKTPCGNCADLTDTF